jgi:hypothetical protein
MLDNRIYTSSRCENLNRRKILNFVFSEIDKLWEYHHKECGNTRLQSIVHMVNAKRILCHWFQFYSKQKLLKLNKSMLIGVRVSSFS